MSRKIRSIRKLKKNRCIIQLERELSDRHGGGECINIRREIEILKAEGGNSGETTVLASVA
jgi:hypothetical protein